MAGLSGALRCEGFIESREFERSKDELKARTGLTDQQIDDRLEGLVWALLRQPSAVAEQVGSRNLWVADDGRAADAARLFAPPSCLRCRMRMGLDRGARLTRRGSCYVRRVLCRPWSST
jgi:hypothetical protein